MTSIELPPDLVEAAIQLATDAGDLDLAEVLRHSATEVLRLSRSLNPAGAYARRGCGLVTPDTVEQLGRSLDTVDRDLVDLLLGGDDRADWQPGAGVNWGALGLPGAPRDLDRDDPLLSALRLLEPQGERPWRQLARDRGGAQLPPLGDWLFWLILAGRGFGKALDVETPIPTPSGFRRLGDLAIGAQVLDETGRPCAITGVYEPQPRAAYRVGFSDGTHLDACDEHQWVTWTHADRKAYLRGNHGHDTAQLPPDWPTWRSGGGHGPRIRTTRDIADTLTYGSRGDRNHCVPTTGPLQLPAAELPVDPWLLGYWLGDGTTREAALTVHADDLPAVLDRLTPLPYGVRVQRGADRAPTVWLRGGLRMQLRALGVLGDKHVPHAYLWASVEQREALLAGLLDSDGTIGTNGHVDFCSTSRRLADAVVHLARSLGQKPVLAESRAVLNGRDIGPRWRVTWRPTRQPFTFKRKADRVRPGGRQGLRNHHRMIVSAEPITPTRMRCLSVDSPNRMYLAGEAMIPTHNTWTGANVLAEWAVDSPGDYALVAPTFGDARKICVEESKSGVLTALGADLVDYNKSDYIVHVRGGSRIILGSSDAPARLRGYNFSGAWLDELASYVNLRELWDEVLLPALRIGRLPRAVITTTGKRGNPVLKELLERFAQQDAAVAVTRGKTSDNLRNLSAAFVTNIYARYAGTAVGRQELDGELLDEVEGALVSGQVIEATRLRSELLVPELRRIVVGVDPAVSDSDQSDKCGIVVMGIGGPPIGSSPRHAGDHLYVLQDATVRAHPEVWALTALKIAHDWAADAIVAERNNGGKLVDSMLRMVARATSMPIPRIYTPWAARGKLTRAEPLSGVWQQGRVHTVGAFPDLEDQWTSWVPGKGPSPDALDASVWAGVYLMPELSIDGAEVRVLV